jgi:hypothetical protein
MSSTLGSNYLLLLTISTSKTGIDRQLCALSPEIDPLTEQQDEHEMADLGAVRNGHAKRFPARFVAKADRHLVDLEETISTLLSCGECCRQKLAGRSPQSYNFLSLIPGTAKVRHF